MDSYLEHPCSNTRSARRRSTGLESQLRAKFESLIVQTKRVSLKNSLAKA